MSERNRQTIRPMIAAAIRAYLQAMPRKAVKTERAWATRRAVFQANGGSAMRELPRDLVTILRAEARNQRTPPIDYVIAEDGGRMVHTPEPDIAMAELLEEAATALASERAAHAKVRKALEQIEQQLDYGQIDRALHIARRALEGGE